MARIKIGGNPRALRGKSTRMRQIQAQKIQEEAARRATPPPLIPPGGPRTFVMIKFGNKHCATGPAVLLEDGTREYWMLGVRHRADGPAVVRTDGSFEYWLYGLLHREDGPAVRYANGDEELYLNGLQLEYLPVEYDMDENGSDIVHEPYDYCDFDFDVCE